jgi:formiminoglutamase
MLLHHPNYLFDYCHLGYQRYFVDKEVLNTFIKLNFEMKSIGQMRDNLQDIEPLVRAADMLSFDVSAIKHTDLPLNNPIHPFGLTGEEACQLSWYAGTNEKLTSVGFYGIEDENKQNVLVSKVVATIIWYFIEGFAHRKVEYSFKSNFHIKYIVPLMGSGKNLQAHELVFYKSRQTDKWWMEIPTTPDEIKNFGRNVIIPCSYTDYETANKGIVPDRWLKAMEKYT